MNRYKPVGWRHESHRHSLAAKGIRTSFDMRRSKPVDVRKLQRRYAADEEVGVTSRAEVKKVDRPAGKKAALMSEEEWLEGAITDLDTEIDLKQEGGSEEELEALRNRRNELGATLQTVKEKIGHLQSRPPVRKVKATEDIPLGLYDRYKGTSGRLPEAVEGLLSGVDLKMPEIEKKAHYERMKRVGREERAAKEVVRRLEDVSEQKAIEEITDTETVQVTEDIIQPYKRGRKKNSFAIIKKAGFYYVDPDDFLDETGQPPEGARTKKYVAELKKGVGEKGVERPGVLEFDTSGKLILHEGRHRAAVSKSVGKKIPVFVDVEGDDTWFHKYFKMYPEEERLKDSSMGRFLKKGQISAAFAYSDREHDKRLRKLFGVPDNLVDLGTLH